MALRFLVVPVRDSGAFEQELNAFLARHQVVTIQRQLGQRRGELPDGELQRE